MANTDENHPHPNFCRMALLALTLMPSMAYAATLQPAASGAAHAAAHRRHHHAGTAAGGLSIDLNGNGLFTDRMIQIVALITVLSIAPSILIMMTSFVRIVVVLSLLRTALGLQQSPLQQRAGVAGDVPDPSIVMTPTLTDAYHQGIEPLR